MSSTQSSIYSPGLSIYIAGLVTAQEQDDACNLVRTPTALRRVQLANLLLGAPGARGLVHRRRHARLDDAGADGVDADARARELVGHCLGERDDAGFGGGVGGAAGV